MRQHQRRMNSVTSMAILCAALAASTLPAAKSSAATAPKLPWDWSGVIGTGQSLAVGDHGTPIKSTNQPYGNLKLSTGALPWPIDSNDPSLAMVPLIEPVGRRSHAYPSSWPDNIAGETPHSAMANQISALVKAASGRDFIGVHGEVGENGQCMIYLKKGAPQRGVNGHSYEAALTETKAITRLAKAAGKTYGVGAITVTHGECDAGNAHYEDDLYQLWSDYNTDLSAITGQTQKLLMIVSQQNGVNSRSASTLAQWKVGVDHPAEFVCSGPKYQYPSAEGVHLTVDGYQQLGEKYGQVYYERVVLGNNWQPLQPVGISRGPIELAGTSGGVGVTNKGTVIRIQCHVPVPPLAWDSSFQEPHQSVTEWDTGKGFEVSTADGAKVKIIEVGIFHDSVIIMCATDPGPNARVGYATIRERARMTAPFNGTFCWGQLRDSDPFVGDVTKKPQPNYCVAFEMTVP